MLNDFCRIKMFWMVFFIIMKDESNRVSTTGLYSFMD